MWFFIYLFPMFTDQYYISFFNRFKTRYKRSSIILAQLYITVLEVSVFSLLLCFFTAFSSQMRLDVISTSKVWLIILVVAGILWFKNWMKFTGKKRNVLKANSKLKPIALWQLIMVPLVCIGLSLLFLQAA